MLINFLKGMVIRLYNVPTSYPYPYYPMYNSELMQRNSQGYQQVIESVKTSMEREATSIDLYTRLASLAPNENHRNSMLQAQQSKENNFQQFSNLYVTLSGRQPTCENSKVSFNSYQEGLDKAYLMEAEGYEANSQACQLYQHPLVQNVLLQAIHSESEIAHRVCELREEVSSRIQDYGDNPLVLDIEEITKENETFRTALWTGSKFQVTLMSIGIGEDIGLEQHPDTDQFLRIEEGQGLVQMGDSPNNFTLQQEVADDFAIIVPAGKWHNLTNIGDKPIKLYSIYAPPEHPFGTVHETKAIAEAAEEH